MSPAPQKGRAAAHLLPAPKSSDQRSISRKGVASDARNADFLAELDKRQRANEKQRQELIKKCSKQEIETLKWLEDQFANLEQLFGNLAGHEPGWLRSQPVGDWLHPSQHVRGYSLNTGAEENWKAGAPYPHRWLIVSCTVGANEDDPYGTAPKSLKATSSKSGLIPQARSKALIKSSQTPAEQSNNRLLSHDLVISLHHKDIGQLHKKIPLSKVAGGDLAPLCTKLFRAILGDDLEKLQELGGNGGKQPRPLLGFLKRGK